MKRRYFQSLIILIILNLPTTVFSQRFNGRITTQMTTEAGEATFRMIEMVALLNELELEETHQTTTHYFLCEDTIVWKTLSSYGNLMQRGYQIKDTAFLITKSGSIRALREMPHLARIDKIKRQKKKKKIVNLASEKYKIWSNNTQIEAWIHPGIIDKERIAYGKNFRLFFQEAGMILNYELIYKDLLQTKKVVEIDYNKCSCKDEIE